jgi:ubiquinone biosynthesis protein
MALRSAQIRSPNRRKGFLSGGGELPPEIAEPLSCRLAASDNRASIVLAASFAEAALRLPLAVVLAVATTAISLRLLGTRRGWGTALVSGVTGWGLGAPFALGLSKWDWGDDGLLTLMVAIAVPITMAVAVALDLVARPGSLASGEQAGLVVTPRPLQALRLRIEVLRRYRELLGLIRDQGFGPFLGAGGKAERAAEPAGVRLRRVLEEAGGVYVKIGQIAATRVDLLPPEICAELSALQNRTRPEPREGIQALLEEELGSPASDVFAEFDWNPLASASIAQTYRARLHTGEPVVVKVQRPGIALIMKRDLAALARLANLAERRTPLGRGIGSGEILAHFARSLRSELDFLREAEAMADMATVLDASSGVRIPLVYRELCTSRVLVQERFEGFTASDAASLEASGFDRKGLAETLLRSTLEQVLRVGFFHADPHPGNVFILEEGTLGLIDFGAVGSLDPIQREAVIDMLASLVRRDVGSLRDGIERVAEMSGAVSAERLERAIARVMTENVRPTGAVDPRALENLVPVLSEFGIRLPGDLVLLSRTLVTLDGTLGVISPGMTVGSAATELASPTSDEPILDWESMVRDELIAALPRLRRLPDRVDRIMTLAARGELQMHHVVAEDGNRIVRTFVNRGLLAFVGATFLLVAAVLLVAADSGPSVSDGTGLFDVLGYGGLFVGNVLLLRVVAGVARDGTI